MARSLRSRARSLRSRLAYGHQQAHQNAHPYKDTTEPMKSRHNEKDAAISQRWRIYVVGRWVGHARIGRRGHSPALPLRPPSPPAYAPRRHYATPPSGSCSVPALRLSLRGKPSALRLRLRATGTPRVPSALCYARSMRIVSSLFRPYGHLPRLAARARAFICSFPPLGAVLRFSCALAAVSFLL